MKNIMSKKFALSKKIIIIAISVILFFVITIFLIQQSSLTAQAKNNNNIVNSNKKLKSNNELILDNKKKEVQKWSSLSQSEKEDVENKLAESEIVIEETKIISASFEKELRELETLRDSNLKVYKEAKLANEVREKEAKEAEELRVKEEKALAAIMLTEDLFLSELEHNFEGQGNISLDRKTKVYSIKIYEQTLKEALSLHLVYGSLGKQWGIMSNNLLKISKEMKSVLGSEYSLNLQNPSNFDLVILAFKDGQLYYDVTD